MLFRVLSSRGDDEMYDEGDGARDKFQVLLKEGKTAFKVTPSKGGSSETDSELIRSFDPEAKEIWFIGPLAGG